MIDYLKNAFDRLPISQGNKEIFNLPNCITMVRIAVMPVLFFMLLSPGRVFSLVIAILFIIASITDLLDGYLARRYNIVTKMGKLLDPIADKLLISVAMIVMIPIGRVPAWIVAIFVIRDIFVDGLRSIASSEGLIIHARVLGKQKTLCQVIAVSALLIHYPIFGIDAHIVGMAILYIALILTAWSGVDYYMQFHRDVIKK